ncbi:hypothetical protein EDB85DRAFT_1895147 [Lactarius pseudohatsudake]|nr:hypothetical protein EDB85DRAFT_1895147 [Lactarius pseudohatsudake]
MFGGNDYHHVRYNASEEILGANILQFFCVGRRRLVHETYKTLTVGQPMNNGSHHRSLCGMVRQGSTFSLVNSDWSAHCVVSATAPSHKPDRPIAMPVASPSRLNRTPPPEDVARAITPDPAEPEESTVYPQSSPQGPEIQGAVREECIPFHVWGIPASSPHASLNGLAAKTVPVTSQKTTPEPNEVVVSVVHKRKPTQVSINPSNLIPWIPSEGNKVVITGHRWIGQVGKLLKLERGSCTIKLESSGEIVHCAVEDVMNVLRERQSGAAECLMAPRMRQNPLVRRELQIGRMSNRPYIPSPSLPVEDFKIKWSYDEDTRLVLHDIDECKTCETWSMHHFVHTTHGNDTLQKAEAARDSLRREMEEWRQELAALRREFQEIQQELKDAVGSQRDDAQTPRRRKRIRRARTPSPTSSVVEVSPFV